MNELLTFCHYNQGFCSVPKGCFAVFFCFVYLFFKGIHTVCLLYWCIQKRWHQIPWIWSYRWLWTTTWVLVSEPRFSAWEAHAPYLEAISLAPQKHLHVFLEFPEIPRHAFNSLSAVISSTCTSGQQPPTPTEGHRFILAYLLWDGFKT